MSGVAHVERTGELPVGHEDQADRTQGQDNDERHARDQASREDPRRDPAGGCRQHGRRRYPQRPERDDLLVARHDPGSLCLQCRCQPTPDDQPGDRDEPDGAGDHDDLERDRPERDRT